jgi:hypothetical protein
MAVACEIKREAPLYEEKLNLSCTQTTAGSHEDVDMIISLKIFTGYRQHHGGNNQQEKILYFEVISPHSARSRHPPNSHTYIFVSLICPSPSLELDHK